MLLQVKGGTHETLIVDVCWRSSVREILDRSVALVHSSQNEWLLDSLV